MPKPKIRLLHNLARVGGTLVSRCLGCMQGVVLLSEIHPLATRLFHPLKQAHEWHGLFSPKDIETLKTRGIIPFEEVIRLVHERAEARGERLVVRDWSHLDFVGVPFRKEPTGRMMLVESLALHFEIVSFCVVRHPLEQFLSLARLDLMQGALTLPIFLESCAAFAEQAARIGFVRYEDFTCRPEQEMQRLCEALDSSFDPSFVDRWADYTYITGDVANASQTSGQRRIRPWMRRPVPEGLLPTMRADPNYTRTLDLLGYEDPFDPTPTDA